MKFQFFTSNSAQTKAAGKALAAEILKTTPSKKAFVIGLVGDLGSGKTTFLQGLAKGLGVQKRIISPTFVIIRQYEANSKQQEIRSFFHIDLYRIQKDQDAQGLGLYEVLNDKNAIIAIEWPEKMGTLLPNKRIDITFEYIDENSRKIIVKK